MERRPPLFASRSTERNSTVFLHLKCVRELSKECEKA